jgi:flagellum-specific ATP synthase
MDAKQPSTTRKEKVMNSKSSMALFQPPLKAAWFEDVLQAAVPARIQGRVWSIRGATVSAAGLSIPVGSICEIRRGNGENLEAEVVGFDGDRTILAPMDTSHGIRPGDQVILKAGCRAIRVSEQLLGKVIDADGKPLDESIESKSAAKIALNRKPPDAMDRPPIDTILPTAVKAIDAFLTLGKGQRIGIFAGSGVGKSTLLGMLARGTQADVVVIGLIGERGREVREFIERDLGEEGQQRAITVVATSDQPALRRMQAAKTATAIAEFYRSEGKDVLLLMDSVTRFAMAQREIGLAAGEVPATRGYPPSVFAMLPQLVERAGRSTTGSITGIYTVLVDGDDTNEPISDALRGLLDGHVHLSRSIASRNRYPAIDILPSLSRLQSQLVSPQHAKAAAEFRQLMAVFRDNEDLISIGAYKTGSNPLIDRAIAMRASIEALLTQDTKTKSNYDATVEQLMKLANTAGMSTTPTNATTGTNSGNRS